MTRIAIDRDEFGFPPAPVPSLSDNSREGRSGYRVHLVALGGCPRCHGAMALDYHGDRLCVSCGFRQYPEPVTSGRRPPPWTSSPRAELAVMRPAAFHTTRKRWLCWPVTCLVVEGRHQHVWSWDYARGFRGRLRRNGPRASLLVRYHVCQRPVSRPRWVFEVAAPKAAVLMAARKWEESWPGNP